MDGMCNTRIARQRTGEFFEKLNAVALEDLERMEHPSMYPANVVLFTERQTLPGVYVILSGEVKLSMNSADGKRLATTDEDSSVQIYAMDIHVLLNLARNRVTSGLTPDECQRYFQSEKCPAP